MSSLDWLVLVITISALVGFGLVKGKSSATVNEYLLAGKSMPWYAMGLSIMATQASAVTFISTTGQAYTDGMRFVQFYFGLPVAMIVIAAVAVPVFYRSGVYTAYEYLERRFDAKTRLLGAMIFLLQRGLSIGISIYAPAIVLSVIFGWNDRVTTLIMGAVIVAYTALGGIPAVTWTDVLQMSIILCGLVLALFMVFHLLPPGVSPVDAMFLAGAAGKLRAIDAHFDLNNRYTLWSGLIGGAFLSLSYFGCDQSQVQRYLTGKTIAQSKLGLLFNALAKIPMQFFILFVGAMVFVFFLFVEPSILFEKNALSLAQKDASFRTASGQYHQAFAERRDAAYAFVKDRRDGDSEGLTRDKSRFLAAQSALTDARAQAISSYKTAAHARDYNDTNYVFLSFVTRYFPAGVVGLIIAVIFSAAMSSSSGEVNSLASVTVIDIYKRHFHQNGSDRHYLLVSRIATVFWGVYAIVFAQYARALGSLIEAVNMIGSLFYGTLLGVFTLAFFFKKVNGTGAFWGMLAGEAAILSAAAFTPISFLWYNVIGAVVVVITASAITAVMPRGQTI